MAIVPFDTDVNIGTVKDQNRGRKSDGSALGSPAGCNANNWKYYWDGCVYDRDRTNDAATHAPTSGSPERLPT